MREKVLFIFNPYSGQGVLKQHLYDVVDKLTKAEFDVTVYPTQAPKDAIDRVIKDAADYDRIICSGGDGTLDEVVTGVMRSGINVPIGYIPTGTTNDFGSSLGIDSDMSLAIETSASDSRFICDVGGFGENYFVYVAAFGIFTDVSYKTDQGMKNLLGHAAYILQGVGSIFDIPNYHVKATFDDGVIEDDFIYGMVTNSLSVGGFKNLLPEDVNLSDGVFEVTLIKSPTNPIELNDIIMYLTGVTQDSSFVYSFKTKHIRLECEDAIPYTLDGEFGGEYTEIDIINHNKAVTFIV